MNNARARELTRILASYHPSLSVRAFPAADGRGSVWWTVYTVPSLGPIRLFTLDALDPDANGWRTPGPWIIDALKALRWRRMVQQATTAFSLSEQAYRRTLALDTANAV